MIDLTGKTFHRWTVIAEAGRRQRAVQWLCRCECGSKRVVGGQSLRAGTSKSCGCYGREIWKQQAAHMRSLKDTHGESNTPTWQSWRCMWARCTKPRTNGYKNYGGRGISICERWKDYRLFVEDMGHRPSGTTLGRKNSDLGYFPDNCRWETHAAQRRNSKQNVFFTFNSLRLCATDWARRLGLSTSAMGKRLSKWPLEKALTYPVQTNKQTTLKIS